MSKYCDSCNQEIKKNDLYYICDNCNASYHDNTSCTEYDKDIRRLICKKCRSLIMKVKN